jgi:hypothetical protein
MERLVVALEDRLGLHLCQTLYWENPAKMPGPARIYCLFDGAPL